MAPSASPPPRIRPIAGPGGIGGQGPGGSIPLPRVPGLPILPPIRVPLPAPIKPANPNPVSCAIYDWFFRPPSPTCGDGKKPPTRTPPPGQGGAGCTEGARYTMQVQQPGVGWRGAGPGLVGPATAYPVPRPAPTNPNAPRECDLRAIAQNYNGTWPEGYDCSWGFRLVRSDGAQESCAPNPQPGPPRGLPSGGGGDGDGGDFGPGPGLNPPGGGGGGGGGCDPCDPNSSFWPKMKDLFNCVLFGRCDGVAGGAGGPGNGSGGDGDGGDGVDDEGDEEKDEKCKGKSELAIMSARIKSLSTFLLGEPFGQDSCDPEETKATINPEQAIRNMAGNVYDFTTNGGKVTSITPKAFEVKSLPELLAALVSVTYVRSGQYRFPSAVADSIVTANDGGFLSGIFGGNSTQNLTDQQAYQQWFLEQFDAVLGKWQQEIEIIDTDLEQAGNQSAKITLPNVAESMAEIVMQLYEVKSLADVLVNFASRTALEQAAIKAEVFKTQALADVTVDFLGCKTRDKKVDMPLLYTLTAADGENPSEGNLKSRNSLPRLLEQSKKSIVISELAQSQNLQGDLVLLRRIDAILRANLTKNFGNGQNMSAKILEMLRDASKLLDLDIGVTPEQAEQDRNDFSTFIEEVERGFTEQSGQLGGIGTPYGRPYDQRPRIREIGRDEDDS